MSDVDIEDTVNKIKNHKSVQGIVIVNSEGAIVNIKTVNVFAQDFGEVSNNLAMLNYFRISKTIVLLGLHTQIRKKMRIIFKIISGGTITKSIPILRQRQDLQ